MKQMLKRKHDMEKQLNDEQTKRIKLEGEVRKLNHTSRQQSLALVRIKSGRLENSRGSASKAWSEYSRQQKYNKKKSLAKGIHVALGFCEDEGFHPRSLELENVDTGTCEVLSISDRTYSSSKDLVSSSTSTHSALYVKDKYCISNEAFHELSMLSNLPSMSRIKKLSSIH